MRKYKAETERRKSLPSKIYVNKHLLKAVKIANKMISFEPARFGYQAFSLLGSTKEDLDEIDRLVEAVTIKRRDEVSKVWQASKRTALFDLEQYGDVSSVLKRRSLSRKGQEDFFNYVICYWFALNVSSLHFVETQANNGKTRWRLVLDNSSSPANYSVLFKVDGVDYQILLRGRDPKKSKSKRSGGRRANKTVAAEKSKQTGLRRSSSTIGIDRYKTAIQYLDVAASDSQTPISTVESPDR